MAERGGVLGGVAKVLNAGGGAVVAAYDISSEALGNVYSSVKKTATVLPDELKHVVGSGLSSVLPGEKGKLEGKIKEYEKKIQALYLTIGKESSKFSDKGMALESEMVKRLLAEVRGYMDEIQALKDRITEIEAERQSRDEKRREPKEKPRAVVEADVLQAVRCAIDDALSKGNVRDESKKTAFERVARNLVSDDHGLRSLAVRELGLMRNRASVLVLSQAAAIKDPELTVDILNALAAIGDPSVVPLFEGKTKNDNPNIRKAALHGLFKFMAESTTTLLIDGLRDSNADVRLTATTILGWMGASEALPALQDRLEDKDARVRKAAITALTYIDDKTVIRPVVRMLSDDKVDVREKALEAVRTLMGIDVVFDIHASSKNLARDVEALQDWWWNKTVAGVDAPAPWEVVETVKETACSEPAAESETIEAAAATDETATAPEDTVAEETTEAASAEFTYDKLMALRKYDLLKLCTDQGFECDVAMTKAELANLLINAVEKKN
ncbi:MAG: HEAT repeat domain-containing protein [Nitrospirota bacterium]|nr:HEAT repeat domain-containing protein [Nitrospirota bacterium]